MKRFSGIFFILILFLGSGNLVGQTPDGYILVGSSISYVTGQGIGDQDMLVYRLDTAGNVVWFDNYGGVFPDEGVTCTQTSDGGFAVAGSSPSYSFPYWRFLLKKLDAGGGESWTRDYGGTMGDECRSLRQTADGGYIIAGDSYSYAHGPMDQDMLVYKVDASGNKQWRKNFGGKDWEWLSTAIQTADGGYLLVGDNVTYTHGGLDFLVYKLNAAGQKQWRKNYGGVWDDATWLLATPIGRQAVQTSDGGYAFCGTTESYTNGIIDFIVYRINAAGQKQWRKNYGGMYLEHSYAIEQTADGGYIIAGWSDTYSHTGMDYDFLVYKLDAAGKKQWRKNYGGMYDDYGLSVQQTADGSYILAGYSMSYATGSFPDADLLVYKLNAAGAKQWRRNYGGTSPDWGGDIRETSH